MVSRSAFLALLGVGVSALAFSSVALAATARTFTPATSWAVSRIDPSNGGSPYCTLARRFDGNTVITFARNTSGEGTVAVDFQQPLFDPSMTYRIALQAGNGLKREFMTRPATPNAVVLRTGQDRQFFEALGASNEMGVILDGTRYAFSIPDFAAGTGQLAGCIGRSPGEARLRPEVAAADAAAARAARAPAGDDALAELRAQLNALRSENAGIVASLKQQQGGTAAQVTDSLPATAENKQLTARLAALEGEKDALVEKLQSERARQQQEAQDERALKQALEDQKSLKLMLEAEREARAALEASLQEKTADAEKRGELRARISALESSNAELKTLRETLETERSKRLAVEKMLQDQKAASAASLEDQERLRARVSELETQNKSLQATAGQVENMKAQLEDTGTRVSMEQARREAAEKALQEMQLSASARAAQISKLEEQLSAERTKMASAEAAKEATLSRQHADEIARLNLEMEKLRTQQAMAEDLKQRAAAEQARRETAEKALQEMQLSASERAAQIARLEEQMNAERSKMSEAEAAKKAALTRQHADELARLNDELQSLRSRQGATDDLKQRAVTEQARREATERELRETRAALSEKEAAMARLTSEVDKVREEASKARVATSDDGKIREMAERLTSLESRNSDLMAQLQTARAQTEAAEKASVTTSANDKGTNEKIVEIGRKAEADRRELQALLEAEKVRREKLEAIMAQGGSNDDRLREMNNQMAELAKRNALLESRLEEEQARTLNAANMPAAGEEAEQLAALRRQLDVLKNDNQMLATRLADSGGRNNAAPAQVVYAGDDVMADALAETKSSLASVMAERDEYRDLLQRERLSQREGGTRGAKDVKENPGANARIAALEEERAELVRKLEYERSRNESIAQGREVPPASGTSETEINARLAAVESEKDRLKKQLEVAQRDVIAARQKALSGGGASDADIAALLDENRKLQTELAASAAGGGNRDVRALETEIAALRAQNNVLSEEINKRLAAAPTRAAMDNAAAEANFKVREAGTQAQKAAAADIQAAKRRFEAAESENIRLARELAQARTARPVVAPIVDNQEMSAPPVMVAQQTVARPPVQAHAQMPAQMPAAQPPVMFTPASIPANTHPQPLPAVEQGPSGQDIAGYLQRAGVPMVSGFEKVAKVSTPQFGAFRWDTGVVFGTAEQQRLQGGNKGFEQAVNAYLQKTRQRCSGTFDQAFDPAQMSATKEFAVADVACVMPDGTGAGAAMLFYVKDGTFNAIAHEGDVSQFDQAMTTRDTLARFLKGVI